MGGVRNGCFEEPARVIDRRTLRHLAMTCQIGHMEKSQESFVAKLIGLPVSRVWRGYGTALFLEFGSLNLTKRRNGSDGEPEGEFGIMIQWSWRIEEENRIICGSESDSEFWPAAFQLIEGQHLLNFDLVGRLPEIALTLNGGFHVCSFTAVEPEPGWAAFDRTSPNHKTMRVTWGSVTID